MMGITHTAMSMAGASLVCGSASPWVYLLAGIGSQIPDLDTTESWVGRAFYPLAKFLEDRFPHRSITHSFFTTLAIAICTIPVLFNFNWKIWAALPVGHLISCFADTFTKSGCQFFYPMNRDIWVLGLNPKNRIATGRPAEYGILASSILILVVTYYVITGGGSVTNYLQKVVFPTSRTAAQLLRKEDKQAIKVKIEGFKSSDNSQVNAEYWAIAANGESEIVITDLTNTYRVAQSKEIVPKRVDVREGRRKLTTRRLRLIDIEAEEWLLTLADKAFISGELQIEDSEEIELPITPPGEMEKVSSISGGVRLNYAQKKDIDFLIDFYILSGEVVIRSI